MNERCWSFNTEVSRLDVAGISMALINKAGMIEAIDAEIPKTSNNFEITHGQAAAGILLNCLGQSGFRGLSNVHSFLANYPINTFMGTDVDASAFSDNALGAALDAISEYGATRMFSNLSSLFVLNKDLITVGHLDSTSIHLHRDPALDLINEPQQTDSSFIDDQRKLAWLYGYSRDDRPDLVQVNILGMSVSSKECKKALPVFISTFNGNVNDSKKMYEFVNNDLSKVKDIYPNLKTLVTDSAAANAETVCALNDLKFAFITRLSDSRNDSKCAISAFYEGKLDVIRYASNSPDCYVELASAGDCEFKNKEGKTVKGRMIVVCNSALKQRKTEAITRRAEAELKKVNTLLNKMRTQPAKCKRDAEQNVLKLKKTLRYCRISEPEYKEELGYEKKGRPSKDTPKIVVSCGVKAEATIDQNAVNEAVKKKLIYVLAAVNTDLSEKEIYETYHNQSDIEGIWRDMKSVSVTVDSLFVKKPERIQALICILSLAVIISRKIESAVREAIEKHNIRLRKANNKLTSAPSYKSISLILQSVGIKNYGTRDIEFTCSYAMKNRVFDVFNILDDWLLEFYKPETYNKHLQIDKSNKGTTISKNDPSNSGH